MTPYRNSIEANAKISKCLIKLLYGSDYLKPFTNTKIDATIAVIVNAVVNPNGA